MPGTNHENRSEEVQEIIGRVSPWIIRWGITSVFVVLVVIICISWFVRYPDVVRGKALITTQVAPIELITKEAGELKILIGDNKVVRKGDVIAYLKNTVKYEDVLQLSGWLESSDQKDVSLSFSALGDIQPAFIRYKLALIEWREQIKIKPQQSEIDHLRNQIKSLQALNYNTEEQLLIFKKEINLLSDKFRTDSILFVQKVISEIDFKERTANFLSRSRAMKSQESGIINNEYQIEELEKQISRLSNDQSNRTVNLYQALENARAELKNAIETWKYRYLFQAPIEGKISYMNFFDDNQYVSSGTNLFTIVPTDNELYARVSMPIQSSGKVKLGQEVNIRLDNYPSEEFGFLIGTVYKISEVPSAELIEHELAYTVIVSLPQGLVTSYDRTLSFKQFLSGEMEIITENRRVIERIFG